MKLVPTTRTQYTNPFDMMDRLFNNWVPSMFRRRESDDFFAPFKWEWTEPFSFGPSVDIEETEKDIIVRAELPGMDRNEFSIELENNVLTIEGEKKHQEEHKDRNYHRMECSYGRFSRRIPLPGEVIAEKAEATYDKGVLTVTLPKTEESKRKRIEIKSN